MVHPVRSRVRRLDTLRLLDGPLADDLDPVAVRIQREGDVPHAPVRELLLELVPGVFDPLARRLDVVDADARVAEAPVRLGVAVGHLVLRVRLGAVVVRELDDALAVSPVRAGGRCGRRVVGEEVQVELVLREGEVVDLLHAEELVECH